MNEYTNLLLQESKAEEEFFKARSEAKQRAVQLENFTHTAIWAR